MTMREEFEQWWNEPDADTGQSYADCYGSPVIAWLAFSGAYAAGQRAAIDDETRRLADVALRESAGQPLVCDWMSAALQVCAAIRSRKEQGVDATLDTPREQR